MAVLTDTDSGETRILNHKTKLPPGSTVDRLISSRAKKYFATVLDAPGEASEDGQADYHLTTIFVYDFETGEIIANLDLIGVVRDVTFSPDEQRIAASCDKHFT